VKALGAALAALLLLGAGAVTAFGGDTSEYRFLGFSADLRYCGFEVHGVMDGSGFPWSTVYLIDVDRNDYAVKPSAVVGEDGESEDQVRSAALEAAGIRMRAFAIEESNTGDFVEADPSSPLRLALPARGGAAALRLLERPTGAVSDAGQAEKMFELDLETPGKKVVLQKDSALPKGRKGATGYRIVGACVNGNKVAAFLEWEKPGFEGPDVRQMVVTGAIP
jgi:predicted secreted protein